MDKHQKQGFCAGCRNDFYNGQGAKECWMLKDAKVMLLWRQPWWTQGDIPGAFVQVRTLSCYHSPGRFGFSEKLPDFAVEPVYLETSNG